MARTRTKIRKGSLQNHPQRKKSLELIEESGRALKPMLYEYQGSAVVHYYALRGNEFAFIAHCTDMTKIPEQQASAGITQLAQAMMSKYGRNAPKTLDPNKQSTNDGEVENTNG